MVCLRSEHHRDSEKEKPSIIDYMMSVLAAAKEMRKQNTKVALKVHLDAAIDKYNEKNKKKRAYVITGESRSMIVSLSKCPAQVLEEFTNHYLLYKHKESGRHAQIRSVLKVTYTQTYIKHTYIRTYVHT